MTTADLVLVGAHRAFRQATRELLLGNQVATSAGAATLATKDLSVFLTLHVVPADKARAYCEQVFVALEKIARDLGLDASNARSMWVDP